MVRKIPKNQNQDYQGFIPENYGQIAAVTTSGYNATIKLLGEIPEPDDPRVLDIVFALEQPGLQTVNVVLNTYGGSWDTAIMLYSMLKAMSSTTFIKTIGISSVYSAGAIIFMAGNERLASYYTDFLIHITRIATPYESSTNSLNYVNKHLDTAKRVMKDIFGEYLSRDELNLITQASTDFYMNEMQALERGIATYVGYIHPDSYLIVQEQTPDNYYNRGGEHSHG